MTKKFDDVIPWGGNSDRQYVMKALNSEMAKVAKATDREMRDQGTIREIGRNSTILDGVCIIFIAWGEEWSSFVGIPYKEGEETLAEYDYMLNEAKIGDEVIFDWLKDGEGYVFASRFSKVKKDS